MTAKEKKVKSSYLLCAFPVIASLLSSVFLCCPLYTMAAFKHELEGEKPADSDRLAPSLESYFPINSRSHWAGIPPYRP